MSAQDTGPLDWRIAITDQAGRPTPEFQRRWAIQRNNNALIGSITSGSGVPIGTPDDGALYVDISVTPYVLYLGENGSWHQVSARVFLDLVDAPHSYSGQGLKLVRVNSGATALEFTSPIAGANPTGTGSDTVTNGTATTFLRSDATFPIQKASSSQFGLVKVDGTTITAASGIISAAGGGGGGPSPFWATAPTAPTMAGVGFTLIQGVGGSATTTNLSRGIGLSITGSGAVDRNALLDIAVPGTQFTLTALIVATAAWRDFVTYGLYIKDVGTGKINTFAMGHSGTSTGTSRVMNWTNLTTFSATSDEMGAPQTPVIWLRIQNDASNNITYSLSADGEQFMVQKVQSKTSFLASVTNCGIWFGVNQQAVPQNVAEKILIMSFTATSP